MTKLKTKLACVTGALLASTLMVNTAQASNPCTSIYQALVSTFEVLGPEVLDMGCARTENSNSCKQKWQDGVERAMEIRNLYNSANDGPGKIGPRRFGLNNQDNATVESGNVKAERVFIGAPVIGLNFGFEITVTGGKSNKTLKVDLCMLDPEHQNVVGNRHFFDHVTMRNAKRIARPISGSDPHVSKTFSNSSGLVPVLYLRKPLGAKGFKYQVKFFETGSPAAASPPTTTSKAKKVRPGSKLKLKLN